MRLSNMTTDELIKFRNSPDGQALMGWVKSAFSSAREARSQLQQSWYINLSMVWGKQQLTLQPVQGQPRIRPSRTPSYVRQKTINRLRSYVRTETSKFTSSFPSVIAVPSTADDDDIRAAYAAEQVWESMVTTRKLKRVFSRAIWWMALTGNGFIKQWWDPATEVTGAQPGTTSLGDIKFESVTPWHLFVGDQLEREIDDQPYIIQAQTKTVSWVRTYYADELKGVELSGSDEGSTGLLDAQFRTVTGADNGKTGDKVTVYEAWVKRGATPLLPDGGLIVMVNDTIVAYSDTFPYKHGQYPYTKLEHIPTDIFYAVSPLVDLIDLQKEYNELRTDIAMFAKRMARPQLLAVEGSIVTSKMTNEPGSIILVRPGFEKPTPLPLAQIPQYMLDQQDRVLSDFEDISGQHQVSKGQAPDGISAGTALSFLKESDDSYLTMQYQNIEQGIERTAVQSLSLFNEYVDDERKLKVIGKDGSFDVLMLKGSDIASGLDVRVEQGSSVGESQAAKQARLMEMLQAGAIDQQMFLRLSELGGAQKILDTANVAARKAQRENLKMAALTVEGIQQATQPFVSQMIQQVQQTGDLQAMAAQGLSADDIIQHFTAGAPPAVPVDDFDIHEVHLEEHNRFRMGQQYEALPQEVKQEFQKHVQEHEQFLQQAMAMQMAMQGGGGMMGPGQPPQGALPQGGPTGAPSGPTPMPDSMAPTDQPS